MTKHASGQRATTAPPGRRIGPWAIALATLLVTVWVAAPTAQQRERANGSVDVFVAGSKEPGPSRVLRPVLAALIPDDGAQSALELRADELRTAALVDGQAPLAGGSAPAGLYRGLHLVLEEPGEPPRVLDFELAADFRVWPGEATTLIVEWNLLQPAEQEPTAAFSLRRGTVTVRSLTLYVTDPRSDRVVAVNRSTDEVFATISVGSTPLGIDVHPLGRAAYVANSGDDTLSVIDPATHRVLDTLTLRPGARPEDVVVAEDGRRLVVSCPGLNLLQLIDPLTNAQTAEVQLSRAPTRLAASPDGRTVYALVPEANQVIAIDLLRPNDPPRVAVVEAAPTDLAVDRFSGRIFVTHGQSPLVSVVSPEMTNVAELQVGFTSYGIALDPSGRRLYLSGGRAGGLILVGADVATIIRRWPTPPSFRVAIDPDGRKLFFTSENEGKLWILDRVAGRMVGDVAVGASAFDLVVVP